MDVRLAAFRGGSSLREVPGTRGLGTTKQSMFFADALQAHHAIQGNQSDTGFPACEAFLHPPALENAHVIATFEGGGVRTIFQTHAAAHLFDTFVLVLGHPAFQSFYEGADMGGAVF